jgi:hypothetical protein
VNPTLHDLLSKAHDLRLVIDGTAISLHVEPKRSSPEEGEEAISLNIFRLVDGKWQIRFNGLEMSRKRSVALTYIHELLSIRHGTISPTELLTRHYGESRLVKSKEEFVDEGYSELHLGTQSNFAEAILTDDARRRMTAALFELKEDLAQLRDAGEVALAFEKKQEIERVEELLRQTKFRNHNARFNGRADRDRKSVCIAIARGLEHIAEDHPALARHLDNSIRTGRRCSYEPETDIRWLL